ncbi:MAG: ZIP family metal transporter [Oscillospiraceae bacterium]|nr:ZIP family metal transporter [Oscillospiraceae bacterium]
MTTDVFLGLLIPFAGTTMGAAMIFVLRREISARLQKLLLGFASGVMIAASVWSLLIPAIEQSKGGKLPEWLPAAAGFLLGIGFLLALDSVIPHLHKNAEQAEGLPSRAGKNTMLLLAVTLHNIPEGMAVGVVFAGVLAGTAEMSMTAALALSIGIALQNFPEGAIVSMPLKAAGMKRDKAFLCGTLSGAVEPIAALITIILTAIMMPVLPYLLAFAAGAMLYVVVEELIPELQEGGHSNIGIIGTAAGFVLMMVLDVALG